MERRRSVNETASSSLWPRRPTTLGLLCQLATIRKSEKKIMAQTMTFRYNTI